MSAATGQRAAAQRTWRKHSASLTRAINSGDPDRIVTACRAAIRAWDQPGCGWPDNWSKWQRALDDSRPWNKQIALEDLR